MIFSIYTFNNIILAAFGQLVFQLELSPKVQVLVCIFATGCWRQLNRNVQRPVILYRRGIRDVVHLVLICTILLCRIQLVRYILLRRGRSRIGLGSRNGGHTILRRRGIFLLFRLAFLLLILVLLVLPFRLVLLFGHVVGRRGGRGGELVWDDQLEGGVGVLRSQVTF